ncbi:MAG: hypothetical protein H6Q00_133 [Holophagaceae bacterium]|nr:hypothetical protein [Holophagaceae bacterium]
MMLKEVRKRLQEALGFIPESTPMGIRVLTPFEALGNPENINEFPLARGKEHLVEATFEGSVGQAFTPAPSNWSGSLDAWFQLDPEDPQQQPLVLAGVNALARHLKLVDGATRHCRNEGPAKCAKVYEERLRARLGKEGCLLQIGLQPAILGAAVRALGADRVRVLDLQPSNVGRVVEGVLVRDGERDLEASLEGVRVALVTGSTCANGTFDPLHRRIKEKGIELILFGTTAAGPAALMGWERWCFEAE